MALFFEYPTGVTPASGKGQVISMSFSTSDHPIMAVATKNGDVSMYLEEGESLDPEAIIHRQGECTAMAWHPKHAICAQGWDDGTVALWTEKDRVLREETNTHKSPITFIAWSPEGSRLLTGDASGNLAVWAGDHRARLTLICQYPLKKQASGGQPITHVVFRAPTNITGDAALLQACPSFFFGGGSGIIYFADDLGHCSEVINVATPLNTMYYSHSKDYLVLVTVDAVLYKYKISPEGKMTQERKVKLSIKGGGAELQCSFAGSGLLAAANSEPVVRVWHLEKDDSYVLSLSDPRHMTTPKDTVTCIAFNPRKRVLAGGTAGGRVVMWRYVGRGDGEPSEQDWDVLPGVEIRQHIASVVWGPGEGLLAFSTKDSASILLETVLNHKTHATNAVIQMSSEQLYVQMNESKPIRITTGIRIKGVDINDKYVLVWNGKRAEVRELKDGMNQATVTSAFATRAISAALHGDTIYTTVGSRIEICSLQGVVKQVITLTENEGTPLYLDVHGDYLAVATSSNIVKLWDISRREPKQLVPGRSFEENPGIIKSVKVNCTGSKISILCNRLDDAGVQIPDSKAYVYDVELDKLQSYEFGPKYYPVLHHWDVSESKLLAIETRRYESAAAAERRHEKKEEKQRAGEEEYDEIQTESRINEAEVTTLFATSDYGVLMQDSFGIDPTSEALMGIHVPFILFMSRPTENDSLPHIKRRTMRDFVGLEKVNDEVKNDLMLFSYHLTTGNMDEAYRAVKKISSTSIWENMAQMCVKTKRLDVAEVCLGNMDNARGARAVREAKKEPEKDAQVAMVAIQLNLLDDAERLYKECGRYDLLVQLYQASGRWKDALKICAQHDRIHLKTTHYLYARYLEAIGDTAGAIKNYEKSETHKHEVPRMLFDSQHISDLETYIKASDDHQLIKWWAQYCESNQQYEDAIKYYSMANETLALVRVYCYLHQDERAAQMCLESNDAAACYHLARQYESQDKISEAIQFYTRAKRFNHGIRLAKEHGLDNELMQLALESNKQLKVDAARYFESREQYDKAVLLYTKGGRITKALELCFKGQLFDTLRTISDDLGSDTDPALLIKCAEFFLQHSQYDKAVHLMITAGEYEKGLNLCIKHGVKITDAMAEKMTPPKEKAKTNEEKNDRAEILKKLAHTCKDQGSYHLACKKYTQAGDQIRAMKCLLKSSDTEKIIYYAAMTKKREIYVLAANYLQNLDWHNDPEIMKTIISFYTKAKAMQQLAVFYDACAQVEIDEYRDYEKALGALREALKYIIKCKPFPEKDAKMASLDTRIRLVERFVEARKFVKTNPDEMIRICNQLLEQNQIEAAIRVGDVFALLIEYYHSIANYQQAYLIIERMRGANIILSPYLDQGMVQTIHNAVGATMQQQQADDHGIGEDIRSE